MIFLLIPLLVVVVAISFYSGVRYTVRALLPGILARMTPEEISDLAKKAAEERPN